MESVVLAAGILGATVMPHALFLHSALTQGRIRVRGAVKLRRLARYEIIDVVIAMGVTSRVCSKTHLPCLLVPSLFSHRQG